MATKTDSLDTIWRTPDALWALIAPILGPDKPPGTVGAPAFCSKFLYCVAAVNGGHSTRPMTQRRSHSLYRTIIFALR